jgi:hypothetical protein
MLAASDTVVITLEWAMLELFRHLHVMQRLQFELDASGERIEQIERVSVEEISGHMELQLSCPTCRSAQYLFSLFSMTRLGNTHIKKKQSYYQGVVFSLI